MCTPWAAGRFSALTILAYPAKGDLEDLSQILKGGPEKMREAGMRDSGRGHSIADDEIKFGYAVTGTIHPQRVKPNSGAMAGDALVFTKRLGTGVISTALKRGLASEENMRTAIDSMLTLNRAACERMLEFDVHGCTDVTGFGLMGHAREMALASGVTLEIEVDRDPIPARRARICARGRYSRRASQQSRLRLLRGGANAGRFPRRSRTCSTIRRHPAGC